MAIFQPFVEFTSSLGMLVVIYFGGRLALQGVLPVADLVAFFLYLEMFYTPVRSLSSAWEAVQTSLAGADRVADLLVEQPETQNFPGAISLPGRAHGEITFRGVNFEYVPGVPVLEDINLDIPAQAVVALVGPTGVGKSTLVSLIPRFYDLSSGAITLDGHDIREITLDSLRQQISLVLQDVFLFYGTVRENILFGQPDATDAEMIEAARVANAHDFILQLPDGYDTLVGERGVKLSGGQKQRLSIARAVLKDAPILILDEATSSVDTETELLIQQALERLMRGRTTIIIAHRLSTVRNADQIVVLEDRDDPGDRHPRRADGARRPLPPPLHRPARAGPRRCLPGRGLIRRIKPLTTKDTKGHKGAQSKIYYPSCSLVSFVPLWLMFFVCTARPLKSFVHHCVPSIIYGWRT